MIQKTFPFLSLLALMLFLPFTQAQEKDTQPKNGLEILMKKHGIANSTAQVTPTICALCGLTPPETSLMPPVESVLNFWDDLRGENSDAFVEKVLIFCPDATGDFLVPHYPVDWKPLFEKTDVCVKGTNVLPSVTPVCFGTIFTGAPPEIHGIRKYSDKYAPDPLKVKTLFDVFAAAGKKVVIVAQKGCSIDMIFRNRPIDYVSTKNSQESIAVTTKFLRELDYDLILCYDGNYDSVMHGKGVHHPKSIAAMRDSIRWYLELAEAADEAWSGKNRLIAFTPDHGAHDNSEGKGTHGSDRAEDAIVNHFYRFRMGK